MELSYRHSNFKRKKIGAIFGVDCSTVSQNETTIESSIEETISSNPGKIDKLSNTKI